jgi:hypothetical protein
MIEKERAEKLKQELQKAKSQTKLTMAIAGISLVAAIIFGSMALQKSTPVIIPEETIAELDEIDTTESIDETIVLNQQIDSLGIVIDTLENRLTAQEELLVKNGEVVVVTDYVGQLLNNAKAFSGTNCNKSLAFLYAAKKIAQADGTTEANKIAMSQMISQCEAAMFGGKTNNSATSSVDNANPAGGQ